MRANRMSDRERLNALQHLSAAGRDASNRPLLHDLQAPCKTQPNTRGDGVLAHLRARIAPTMPPQHEDKGTRRAGMKEQKPGAARFLIQRALGMVTAYKIPP